MATTTVTTATELQTAVNGASPGDEIIAEPGTYGLSSEVTLDTENVTLKAENDAIVNDSNLSILDFDSGTDTQGVHIYADDVTVRGFEITNPDKHGITTFVGGAAFRSGDYPARATIRRCDVHDTVRYGLQLPGQDFLVQEVDSYRTGSDQPSTYGDGFQCGDGYNHTFVACRAWNNRDDGWDLLNGQDMSLYHCWTFQNPGGISNPNPNGCTGFKLGIKDSGTGVGSGGGHYLERCVAYDNTLWGYSSNNSDNASTLVNCTAWSNGDNDADNFAMATNENGDPVPHVLKNCLNLDGTLLLSDTAVEVNNSWNVGLDNSPVLSKTHTDADFLRIPQGSELINAGTTNVPASVQYRGSAPDLGAFERWRAVRTHASPADNETDWHVPFNAMFGDVEADFQTLAQRIQSLRGAAVSVPTLNQPEDGLLDWHVPVNENFSDMETVINTLAAEANAVGAGNSVSVSLTEPSEGTSAYDADVDSNLSATSTALSNLEGAVRDREEVSDAAQQALVKTTTTIEDHEGGFTAANLYDGDEAEFSVVSTTALEGTNALENTGGDDSAVGYANDPAATARGNTYTIDVVNEGQLWFLVGVQDPATPLADCYGVRIASTNDLELIKRSSTNGNSVLTNSYASIQIGFEYALSLNWLGTGQTDNLIATVYDENGDQIQRVTATDDEHTGGTYGVYAEMNAGSLYDTIQRE